MVADFQTNSEAHRALWKHLKLAMNKHVAVFQVVVLVQFSNKPALKNKTEQTNSPPAKKHHHQHRKTHLDS